MTNKYNIRTAERNDIPIIQDIAYRTWPSTFKNILTVEQIQYMLEQMYHTEELQQRMKMEGQNFYLIEDESQTLGFLELALHYPTPQTTKIHKIYILPTAQHKGLGQKLFEFAEMQAVSANNEHLILNVNKFNSAISFYEKLGFKKIDQEVIDIGNGFVMDDYVYSKSLK